MALEQICGMSNLAFTRSFDELSKQKFIHDFKAATSNFDNPYSLMATPFQQPVEFTKSLELQIDHGTTTLGFKYQGGIILAADSRATSKNFISSQKVRKIVELNSYILGTIAGGAADCTYWDRVLTKECRLHELRHGKRMPVISAARVMCNTAHQYKGMGLVMGMMLAGYDDDGPHLIYIDSDGVRIHGNMFSVGSGMAHAISYMDTNYKFTMADEDAYDLAAHAIYCATQADIFSGGNVSIYRIYQDGWKRVASLDTDFLHDFYSQEKYKMDHNN